MFEIICLNRYLYLNDGWLLAVLPSRGSFQLFEPRVRLVLLCRTFSASYTKNEKTIVAIFSLEQCCQIYGNIITVGNLSISFEFEEFSMDFSR